MKVVLDEAEALAETVGDQRRLGHALNYKAVQFALAGDSRAALKAGLRGLAIGEAQADVAQQIVANCCLGLAYMAPGECREAVRHCEATLALVPGGSVQERFGFASILSSFVRNTLAIALGALGRFAEGFERLREAMHIAEEAGHVYSLLFPLFGLGILKFDLDLHPIYHVQRLVTAADGVNSADIDRYTSAGLARVLRDVHARSTSLDRLFERRVGRTCNVF